MLLVAALLAGLAAKPAGPASILAEREGEQILLRAIFDASAHDVAELSYQFDVTKAGDSGRSTTRQSGRFTPYAGRPDTLATVRLGIRPGDEVDARLTVHGPRGVVAETQYLDTIR